MSAARDPMFELRGVSKRFEKRLDVAGRIARRLGAKLRDEIVHAVDGVDLTIGKGEVVGLVGESGCGKSTLGRMVAGILPLSEGEIRRNGVVVARAGGAPDAAPPALRDAKLRTQMIFQDPYASLNPRMRVADIVGEAPLVHGIVLAGDFDRYVDEQFRRAGLDPSLKRRYPHQFSGGQRQRISIARALATQPEFLVCDEPTSALDVSVQAQVLNIMKDLQRERGLTYLFISHNLAVVRHVADEVGVMYLGRLVEVAPKRQLFSAPRHPYTRMLLDAIPDIHMTGRARTPVQGEVPNPLNPPAGCAFHPRCPHANARCSAERPVLLQRDGAQVACHAVEEGRLVPADAPGS
jgi:peptide/nickel transport system ATP-binding protein